MQGWGSLRTINLGVGAEEAQPTPGRGRAGAVWRIVGSDAKGEATNARTPTQQHTGALKGDHRRKKHR